MATFYPHSFWHFLHWKLLIRKKQSLATHRHTPPPPTSQSSCSSVCNREKCDAAGTERCLTQQQQQQPVQRRCMRRWCWGGVRPAVILYLGRSSPRAETSCPPTLWGGRECSLRWSRMLFWPKRRWEPAIARLLHLLHPHILLLSLCC